MSIKLLVAFVLLSIEATNLIGTTNLNDEAYEATCESTAYIVDKYKPQPTTFICTLSGDYVGRFYIPSVGVDVALYDTTSQDVCDAKDSACIFPYGNQRVIGDHANQGFDKIKLCQAGDMAYIINGDTIEEFICVNVTKGHNADGWLILEDGTRLENINSNGLSCYTCNGSWRNIIIVEFQKN